MLVGDASEVAIAVRLDSSLARCAGKDKYFAVVDQIYSSQPGLYDDPNGVLSGIAKKFGIDDTAYAACVRNEAAINALTTRVASNGKLGNVSGTPTFVINGKALDAGYQSLAVLGRRYPPRRRNSRLVTFPCSSRCWAAVLHASWNALLRSRGDRLNSITVMCAMSAVAGGIGILALPHPARASWPFLAFSTVLQTLYCVALVRAYREGLLAEVYPIARGSSPALVTTGAMFAAHERLGPAALVGVVLVSAGILGIAFGRNRVPMASVLSALVTGALIAGYTLTDGLGGRASGAPFAYACWLFFSQGLVMILVFVAIRRRAPHMSLGDATLKSAAGGVLSLAAYGVVIWALSRAPMGQVSALRETGILFALIIGVAFLKERPSGRQLLAGAAIAAGAALLA